MPITARGFDDADDGDEKCRCPECNAEVYRIADSCPKCGYWFLDVDRAEMRRGRSVHDELRIVKKVGLVLGAVLVVAIVIALVMIAATP
jgi:hypothetical protein